MNSEEKKTKNKKHTSSHQQNSSDNERNKALKYPLKNLKKKKYSFTKSKNKVKECNIVHFAEMVICSVAEYKDLVIYNHS